MWTSDQITIEIEEAEGPEMIVVIGAPVGAMRLMGAVGLVDGVSSSSIGLISMASRAEAFADQA